MKKLLAIILGLSIVLCSMSAFAADVSGYEAHASINLEPFKSDFYKGSFDSISCTAELHTYNDIRITYAKVNSSTIFTPSIDMTTVLGQQIYEPYFFLRKNPSSGLYCVIGQNRYLMSIENGYITIGKRIFEILKEIASTEFPVTLAFVGFTGFPYVLTQNDIDMIKQFISDLEISGIAETLDDDNTIIISQYN